MLSDTQKRTTHCQLFANPFLFSRRGKSGRFDVCNQLYFAENAAKSLISGFTVSRREITMEIAYWGPGLNNGWCGARPRTDRP